MAFIRQLLSPGFIRFWCDVIQERESMESYVARPCHGSLTHRLGSGSLSAMANHRRDSTRSADYWLVP